MFRNRRLPSANLNRNLLHVELNSASYNCTVNCGENLTSAFLKDLLCFAQLEILVREKNTETDRFHGNRPYCKIPIENQPIRVLHFSLKIPCDKIKLLTFSLGPQFSRHFVTVNEGGSF